MSYRDLKPYKTIQPFVLSPFHFIFSNSRYIQTHTRTVHFGFSSFASQTCCFLLGFSSFMLNKLAGLVFSPKTNETLPIFRLKTRDYRLVLLRLRVNRTNLGVPGCIWVALDWFLLWYSSFWWTDFETLFYVHWVFRILVIFGRIFVDFWTDLSPCIGLILDFTTFTINYILIQNYLIFRIIT